MSRYYDEDRFGPRPFVTPDAQPKEPTTMDTAPTHPLARPTIDVDIALIGTPALGGPPISSYSTKNLTTYALALDARIHDLRLSAFTLEATALVRINSELARREQVRIQAEIHASLADVGRVALRMYECDPAWWNKRFPVALVEQIRQHQADTAMREIH